MKIKRLILAATMIVVAQSCVLIREFTDGPQADYFNPCTDSSVNPYQDCQECRQWYDRYPNQYHNYAKRMHARKIKFCRF